MKLLLLLLFSISCLAQNDKTRLYITVVAADIAYKPTSVYYHNVMLTNIVNGKGSLQYFANNIKGEENKFTQEVPKNMDIRITTGFSDYYQADTLINTTNKDSIYINLVIKPKYYQYTAASAEQDIKEGIIQFIIFDRNNWGNQLELKKKFGFEYLVLEHPKDYDFERQMMDYTFVMEEHLTSINPTWRQDYKRATDSLLYRDIDVLADFQHIDIKKLNVPKFKKLPAAMKEQLSFPISETERFYFDKVKGFTVPRMLDSLYHSKNYVYVKGAGYWLNGYYRKVIPELIGRLTDKTEVGLINYCHLLVNERPSDPNDFGEGGYKICSDDIFTIAGRANYLLSKITGEDFGDVSVHATEADLKKLQNRWAYWLLQLQE